MLRAGLTGNLGSGKSTVAGFFARKGAHIVQSDAIGRELMQPGQAVFDQIVRLFGTGVLLANGFLDRTALARFAFAEGRVEELNAIVHPAVIARQGLLAEALAERSPHAVLIVESALIFDIRPEATNDVRGRFDRVVLVTAPESEKIARFLHRTRPAPDQIAAQEAEARRRLALQIPDARAVLLADHVLVNDGTLGHLEAQVDALWPVLVHAAHC